MISSFHDNFTGVWKELLKLLFDQFESDYSENTDSFTSGL